MKCGARSSRRGALTMREVLYRRYVGEIVPELFEAHDSVGPVYGAFYVAGRSFWMVRACDISEDARRSVHSMLALSAKLGKPLCDLRIVSSDGSMRGAWHTIGWKARAVEA